MPHFDWTISFGNIAQILTVAGVAYGVWVGFKTRIELLLTRHAELLMQLQSNFDKHEEQDARLFHEMQQHITQLVGSVQRLVGQYEVLRHERPTDRRQS